MESLNVKDLPEPIVRALEAVVQAVRDHHRLDIARKPERDDAIQRELPLWPGTVIGRLTREEIYDDVR